MRLPRDPGSLTGIAEDSGYRRASDNASGRKTLVFTEAKPALNEATPAPAAPRNVRTPFNWAQAAVIAWALVALALLLRLCAGFAMSRRLLRSSRATQQIEIRESDRIAAPVTLGIMRPVIVLPADWPQWNRTKLDAVLAHERSHIRRHDPAVQLFSAIHRALLWHSPLSWFLHKQIVRTAEEASDDAALAATRDRAFYAEILLDFMQRTTTKPTWLGVPMARYGPPDTRINRILDGTTLSREISKWTVAAILALASPFAYVIAAAHPQTAPLTEPRLEGAAPKSTLSPPKPVAPTLPQQIAQSPKPAPAPKPLTTAAYLEALGNVTSLSTVTIKPRMDGQLTSVKFKEGEEVQQGQLLAEMDSSPLQLQLHLAEGQLRQDRQFGGPDGNEKRRNDQYAVDNIKLQLNMAQIRSPIKGVAGLRLIDPGNMIHAGESLVVITQLHPIAVLFTIPEDRLFQVREHLKNDATVTVEA